uniref:Uncharacterized protein n=1 Tax=Oryza punctata TaxID=4537 RepID=A0A0E0JVM7_ORYPU
MQARVVVFPVKGRAWCFARPRATAPAAARGGGDGGAIPPPPTTVKDLWRGIAGGGRTASENAEAVVDFVADKMNRAWIGFGSAPEGSMKNRIHSFGLKLLSRVRPSEVLLKSVTKDFIIGNEDLHNQIDVHKGRAWVAQHVQPFLLATCITRITAGNEVLSGKDTAAMQSLLPAMQSVHQALLDLGLISKVNVSMAHSTSSPLATRHLPACSGRTSAIELYESLCINPRLVRRRLRHIAVRGASVHRKFLYGSVCLLPVTSVFMVLPLPNIPFFWVLFRAYSHWRALQGSERLQLLVSDSSDQWKILLEKQKEMSCRKDGSPCENTQYAPWPSKKLDGFLERTKLNEGLDCDTISRICQAYDLDKIDVLKYRDLE